MYGIGEFRVLEDKYFVITLYAGGVCCENSSTTGKYRYLEITKTLWSLRA